MPIIQSIPIVTILVFSLYMLQKQIIRLFSQLSFFIFGRSWPAVYLYFLIFLPGVILHELAHYFTASILNVPVGRLSVFPRRQEGDEWSLGQVASAETDIFRSSLIGFAPMLIGSLSIILINHFGLRIESSSDFSWLNTLTWQTIIWLYLMLVFANTMFLSSEDRTSIWVLPGLLLIIFLVIKVLSWENNLSFILGPLSNFISLLVLSFLMAITVDLAFFLPLWLIKKGLHRLLKS